MGYTKEERNYIKQGLLKNNPELFKGIEMSYNHFLTWYNDDSITDNHKEVLLDSMMIAATPSVLYPQYIRLEIIEYWKERFKDYPDVLKKLSEIR